VLEYLDGEDLASRLTGGPLPVDQALAIARQIGSALKAAHAAQVVHRDLKPGNIFLVGREVGGEIVDHVKVLDFGISKIRNSNTVQTQDAILLGTPQYMAPEQAQGKNNEIDARTDVFALGAICYEMISGKAPFAGDSLAQVVFKVVYEPVAPLAQLVPGVSPTVAAAIERAMAKGPADRFSDMSGFVAALTGRELVTTDRRAVRGTSGAVVPSTHRGTIGHADTAAASQLRGELQARPEQGGSARKLAFLLAAIVVGAAGTFAGVRFLGGTQHGPTPVPANTPTASAGHTLPVHPIDSPAIPDQPHTGPAAAKPEDAEPDKSAVDKKKTEAKTHAVTAVAEPPEVQELLDQAERALSSDNTKEALLLSDRAMRVQKSTRIFSLQTRIHCHNQDLGNARATFSHVAGGERARVLKYCRAQNTPLD
jgi:serine/threonine-protein kinase